jgi:hypothetical protein
MGMIVLRLISFLAFSIATIWIIPLQNVDARQLNRQTAESGDLPLPTTPAER